MDAKVMKRLYPQLLSVMGTKQKGLKFFTGRFFLSVFFLGGGG